MKNSVAIMLNICQNGTVKLAHTPLLSVIIDQVPDEAEKMA